MKVAILPLLAACTAFGAPTQGKSQVAKFDDITVIPGTGFVSTPPPKYKGLALSGFGIETNTAGDLSLGTKPHSSPNDIFYAATTGELDGAPTIKNGKNGKTFSLKSMYFSCTADVGAVRVPTECTVVASAISRSGKRKSTTFTFAGGNKQVKATFPKQFNHVKSVTFTSPTSSVGTLPGTFTTSIDNIEYILD